MTKGVCSVMEEFAENNALASPDIVSRLEQKMNRTTVYRILDRLEKSGMIHSFSGKEGQKWYAKSERCNSDQKENHAHFQCKECGKTECLSIEFTIPKVEDRRIDSANLLLVGHCTDCGIAHSK